MSASIWSNLDNLPVTPVYPVVGMSFIKDYPNNVRQLSRESEIWPVRDSENPYDGNAVQVHSEAGMLGHLSKEKAVEIAPRLDAGEQLKVYLYRVRVSPENPDNPGLDISIEEAVT